MRNKRIDRFFTWIMFVLCVEMMVVSVLPHHHHHNHVCLLHDSEYFCDHEGEEHHDADPDDGQHSEDTCITNFTAIFNRSVLDRHLTCSILSFDYSGLPAEFYTCISVPSVCSQSYDYRLKVPIVHGSSFIFSLRAPPALVSC